MDLLYSGDILQKAHRFPGHNSSRSRCSRCDTRQGSGAGWSKWHPVSGLRLVYRSLPWWNQDLTFRSRRQMTPTRWKWAHPGGKRHKTSGDEITLNWSPPEKARQELPIPSRCNTPSGLYPVDGFRFARQKNQWPLPAPEKQVTHRWVFQNK